MKNGATVHISFGKPRQSAFQKIKLANSVFDANGLNILSGTYTYDASES